RRRHRRLRHALLARGVRAVPALRPLDARPGDRDLRRGRRAAARAVSPRAGARRRSDGSDRRDVPRARRARERRGADVVRGDGAADRGGRDVKLRFWGVRGSFAMSGRDFLRYGGNTTSIELVSAAGSRLLVDLGTGATELAKQLMAGDFGKGQ